MRLVLLLAAAAPLVAQCTFTIAPAPAPAPPFGIPATAGTYTIDVQAPAGCGWSYGLSQSSPAWITIASGPTNGRGSGNGSIAWNAAPNPYPTITRQATFVITPDLTSSYVVTISQSPPACKLALSPSTPAGIGVAGGSGSFNVGTNCVWYAVSNNSWIKVPYTTGTSDGAVNFTVDPNACVAPRSGSVSVIQIPLNPSFTINQDGSDANLTIAPATLTVPAAAAKDAIAVQVNTGTGCGWSSSRDVSWMRVASGSSGAGSATMLVVVDANPSPDPRTGHITIGKAVFTLTQQGTPAPVPQLSYVENAASFAVAASAAGGGAGGVSPGEIVSLFGTNMGPVKGAGLQLNPNGLSVSNSLAGVQVLFDGTPAALTYVSAKQINTVVPYGVSGSTKVQVEYQSASNALTVPVAAAVPGVFAADASGSGGGAILNQDGVTLNSYANPAPPGSVVSIYCTGGGATKPASVDGAVTALAEPFPRLSEPVTVTIGGAPSPRIWYAGGAPGAIAGLTQINAEIPAGIPSGPNSLVVQIGNQPSQAGVVVYVQ